MTSLLFGTVMTTLCLALLGFQAVSARQGKARLLVQHPHLATGLYIMSWLLLVASFVWAEEHLGLGQGTAFWLCAAGCVGLTTLYIKERLPSVYRWICLGAPIAGIVLLVANVPTSWLEGGG